MRPVFSAQSGLDNSGVAFCEPCGRRYMATREKPEALQVGPLFSVDASAFVATSQTRADALLFIMTLYAKPKIAVRFTYPACSACEAGLPLVRVVIRTCPECAGTGGDDDGCPRCGAFGRVIDFEREG